MVLLLISSAWAQQGCGGVTVWLCEKPLMYNAAPLPNHKFDRNSIPKELLEVKPSGPPQTFRPDTIPNDIQTTASRQVPRATIDKETLAKGPCLSRQDVQT